MHTYVASYVYAKTLVGGVMYINNYIIQLEDGSSGFKCCIFYYVYLFMVMWLAITDHKPTQNYKDMW